MAPLIPPELVEALEGKEVTTISASELVKKTLQNARQLKNAAASLDVSQIGSAAQDPAIWPNLVQTSLTTLLTQKTLFDLAIAALDPEVAQFLEPLRAANETALQGVRALQDATKKSRKVRQRENKKQAKSDTSKKATVEDLDQEEASMIGGESSQATTTSISEHKTLPGKKSKKNTETNGETHAHTAVPSIERPQPAATTPAASKTKTTKPPPTPSQIEANKSRGIGQPEAMVLLKEYFASTPVRKMITPNVESSPLKRKSPSISKDLDEQGKDAESVKISTKASEDHDGDINPAKKKKVKVSAKDKRKSDVSMKDASAVSTPEMKKSKTPKFSHGTKSHPNRATLDQKSKDKDIPTEQLNPTQADEPQEPVYEFEDIRVDITAAVDEKMRKHHQRLEREEKAKKHGLNPAEKRPRESLGKADPSGEINNNPENGASSVKKRKIHKSKSDGSQNERVGFSGMVDVIERKRKSPSPDLVEPVVVNDGASSIKKRKVHKLKSDGSQNEKAKFRGIVDPIERKRKSPSPDTVERVLAKDGAGKKSKKEKKEERAAKKIRERGWVASDRDGEGDVVMS